MAEKVDAVIIGGGIAGASMAYYLAHLGVGNVLVLERSAVPAGASGLVVFCEATRPDQAALLKVSADFYASWEAEIGGPSAITRVGALMPVSVQDVGALEHEVAVMQGAGHDVRLVGQQELYAESHGAVHLSKGPEYARGTYSGPA